MEETRAPCTAMPAHARCRRALLAAFAGVALAFGFAACGAEDNESQPTGADGGMASMSASAEGQLPPAEGFYDGQPVLFVHPETSDPKVGKVLTEMMASPVVVVPELADTPDSALADVYAFENGVRGDGPFGYQPDVFDSAPGDDGYSPLRAVHLVSWKKEAEPRVLRSVKEVRDAEKAGDLTVDSTDVVVNMPFVKWPDGSR